MRTGETIRVLHIFGALDKGGAESRTMDIYRAIDRDRVQFDFVVHTDKKGFFEPEIVRIGGRVYHSAVRFRVINFVKCYKFWLRFFKVNRYKIVHIHATNMAPPILLAAKTQGIKYRICHSRSASEISILRKFIVLLMKPLINKFATHRLAVSDKAGKFTFGKGYRVIRNAISAQQFRFNQIKREEVRKLLGVQDKFAIGHVGNFRKPKNHVFLLDMFVAITRSEPSSILLLVGDGKLRVQIERKAAEAGVADRIIFLGARDDIPDLLQAFDLFLMPSLYEGMPGAALEAQAIGLPCLLSNTITEEVKVIDDLVEFLPIDGGISIWVDRILEYVKTPFERRDTYEEVIKAGFDIVEVVKWYESFYLSQANH